jgi:hypothetical protein
LWNAKNQVIPTTIHKQIDNITNSGLEKLQSFVGTTFKGCGDDVKDYFDLSPGQIVCDYAFLSTTKDKSYRELWLCFLHLCDPLQAERQVHQ